MKSDSFVLKGDVCYSSGAQTLETVQSGYLVCVDGVSKGVFRELPEGYRGLPLYDYSGMLVTPGLTDLHVHAPQYTFRGLGMDMELLDWLNTQVFPEESKYRDPAYAEQGYGRFVEDMRRGPNTRACVFATLHRKASVRLMELLEGSGLVTMVGKVNMDRNSPDSLRETDAEEAERETRAWLEETAGRYARTTPILTPRFIPSCTDELMRRLHTVQREYRVPVQSHLSESPGEIAWVKELCQIPGATAAHTIPSDCLAVRTAPPLWRTASTQRTRRSLC